MNCYDSYPGHLLVVNVLQGLGALAIGVIVVAQFGLWAVLGYVLVGVLALTLALAFGCTRCHYYGRLCGMGLGKMAALVLKKRDEAQFGESLWQRMSWILVGVVLLLPIGAGLILLREAFTSYRLMSLVAFLTLLAAIVLTHSRLVCNHCWEAKEGHCALGRSGKGLDS